jgi:hypothetical protein
MLSQTIWWSCIILETLLLVRGFREKLLRQYPIFYAYIACVLLQSLLRFYVNRWHEPFYRPVYWATEFLGLVIGCGIVFEVYRVGLAAYQGTARVTRKVLAFLFLVAFVKALADAARDPSWWTVTTALGTERALRTAQGLAIAALVALFLFYSIPFGRNLRGILLGYALFIGERLVCLTFVSNPGTRFYDFWNAAYSASYVTVLFLWTVYLWSSRVIPVPKASVDLAQEYQFIAAATRRRLQETRGYLGRAVRS